MEQSVAFVAFAYFWHCVQQVVAGILVIPFSICFVENGKKFVV